MNHTRIFALCLAVVMLVLTCPTGRTHASVSNEYAMSDGKIEIIKYIGSLDDVVVPSEVGGFPVVAIRARAFFGNAFLRSVVIPDSVKSIRAYAFLDCKALTGVEIPAGVTWFEEGVFCGCSALERVTLPEGLTRIGTYGFYGCSVLTELSLPASVQALGDFVCFLRCRAV